MINSIFTLATQKDAKNTTYFLKKNGMICFCPFRQKTILPHPTLQNQIVIENPACTNACQFFNLQGNQLNLLCADFTEMVEIEETKQKSYLLL
jgi:hypothetical protein